ncbi:MAG: PTS sugar transporter subunit IIA [Coprococcus sp.]
MFLNPRKELLLQENIRVNCKADTQEQVIRQVGQMLVDSGYVKQSYVDGMVRREKTFSTFMGNGLALPWSRSGEERSNPLESQC